MTKTLRMRLSHGEIWCFWCTITRAGSVSIFLVSIGIRYFLKSVSVLIGSVSVLLTQA